ncbi:hypothetical protein ACFQY0_11395 [Haloferula chungangensis]|uniref:Agarase n=1 Tax=Haloferula chungangensis TaxID=1048331 RepID=A0ABW2L9E7_9BACT
MSKCFPSEFPDASGSLSRRHHGLSRLPLSAWACAGVLGFLALGREPAPAAEVALMSLPSSVKVASAPDRPWTDKKTRTLADLPAIPVDEKGSRFGGTQVKSGTPSGFFRTSKLEGRWWLVDPDGYLFVHRGVTSVNETRTKAAGESLIRQFGSRESWAESTSELLKDNGFNGLGAWCDEKVLQPASTGLVYTKLWNFMSSYGRSRRGTSQGSGHTKYTNGCPFIFDPEFAAFCDERAKALKASKEDPWLLGHFTDNELPWSIEMLERYLELPENEAGYVEAWRWLRERHGAKAEKSDITKRDRAEFVGHAADTYFSIVSRAIRKYDPNHLILGSRFHGRALRIPELFEAAGRHIDVISVNYYHAWSPDQDRLASWSKSSGKPIIISEWYAKAMDSGLTNTGGVGWLVKTQADRAAFYQNFTLGLLESKSCIGWHWFRYSDNDPDQKGVDPSNRDSNKGIVTSHYKPYEPLLNSMKELNLRTLGIVRHFDRNQASD